MISNLLKLIAGVYPFKLKLHFFILCCFCYLTIGSLWAQQFPSPWYKPDYVTQIWNNQNGLPQNTVFDIKKDEKGFLWIATEEGLVRFDGHEFLIYNQELLPELPTQAFYAIAVAKKGGIWGASDKAIVRVQGNKTTVSDFSKYTRNTWINYIAEDSRGNLIVGTHAGSLLYLENGKITQIAVWPYLNQKTIQDIKVVSDGVLIGTDVGLFKLDARFKTLAPVKGFETLYVRALAEDSNQTLWIGTKENGLFKKDKGTITNYTDQQGLPELYITAVAPAPDGSIWVGTNSSGVYQLKNGAFKTIQTKGLPTDGVRTILFTDPNLIWLGTAASGLVQLKPATLHMLSDAYPLAGNIILPIYQHKNGDIWIGTAGNGVNRISPAKTSTYTKAQGLAADLVLTVGGTREAVFIGTPSGLSRFDLKTGKINRTYTERDGLASNVVFAALADKSNTLWIGTRAGGIHTLKPDGKLDRLRLPPLLSRVEIASILIDAAQNKWFGTRGAGLIKVTPNGEIKNYNRLAGFPADEINCLYQDATGTLWMGTENGLVFYSGGKFRLLNKSKGLHFNGIQSINADKTGSMWLGGTYGLQRILLANLEKVKAAKQEPIKVIAQLYNTADGIRNAELNGGIFPASFKMADGTIWFPTIDGVTIVDPASINNSKNPVTIYIKDLRFGNTNQELTENVSLPVGINNLQIDYTSIEFTKPGTLHFYYRLKGIQENWEFAGNRRTAYFNTLAPDTYTFEVKAEQNGVWSDTASLTFTIQPFFYQTIWFKALLLSLLFLAGYLAKRFRANHQQEARLKALVEERTKDLKESNDRFQLVNKATSDVIWDYDLVKNEIYWGENLTTLLEHNPLNTETSLSFRSENLHPEDATGINKSFLEAISGEENYWQGEYRLRKGNDQYAYIIDRGYILRDEKGKAIRMLGAMQDLTKIKEEEQRLKLLESVITNASDAVIVTKTQLDAPGPEIVYVNQAFLKMTGYTRNEIIGQSPRFLQGRETDKAELYKLKSALQNGKPEEIGVINYRKNGESFFVSMNISPVTDPLGNTTHFIGILRDFTEQKQYLEAIEKQNAKLSEIAWMQSHVVRAPLARILGIVHLLEDSEDTPEERQKLFNFLKTSSLELDEVIKEIVNKAENVKK